MKQITQIQDVTVSELQDMLTDAVRAQFSELKDVLLSSKSNNEDNLLTPKEVCELLGISKVTLWNYQNSGKFQVVGIGQKRYYKRADVMNALRLKK